MVMRMGVFSMALCPDDYKVGCKIVEVLEIFEDWLKEG